MFDSIHYDQRYVSLLEVYQSGSFTAAGNVLSLTPSAVTQQVHSIEREINALLFIKSEHKLIPTKECEVVIKYINKIQSMCRRMSDDIELSKKNHAEDEKAIEFYNRVYVANGRELFN